MLSQPLFTPPVPMIHRVTQSLDIGRNITAFYFLTIVLSTIVAVGMKFVPTCRQRNLSSTTALLSTLGSYPSTTNKIWWDYYLFFWTVFGLAPCCSGPASPFTLSPPVVCCAEKAWLSVGGQGRPPPSRVALETGPVALTVNHGRASRGLEAGGVVGVTTTGQSKKMKTMISLILPQCWEIC